MEYRDWHILQTLFQEQNITKTAEVLYISQPALTKRLRQIENVEFKVITGWSKDVYKSVYNQDVHVGFVRGNYNWTNQKLLLVSHFPLLKSH